MAEFLAPKPRPFAEWIKTQNRFRHLLRPENRHLLDMLQEQVNRAWSRLLRKCEGRLLEV